jgi:hypothetical protein
MHGVIASLLPQTSKDMYRKIQNKWITKMCELTMQKGHWATFMPQSWAPSQHSCRVRFMISWILYELPNADHSTESDGFISAEYHSDSTWLGAFRTWLKTSLFALSGWWNSFGFASEAFPILACDWGKTQTSKLGNTRQKGSRIEDRRTNESRWCVVALRATKHGGVSTSVR